MSLRTSPKTAATSIVALAISACAGSLPEASTAQQTLPPANDVACVYDDAYEGTLMTSSRRGSIALHADLAHVSIATHTAEMSVEIDDGGWHFRSVTRLGEEAGLFATRAVSLSPVVIAPPSMPLRVVDAQPQRLRVSTHPTLVTMTSESPIEAWIDCNAATPVRSTASESDLLAALGFAANEQRGFARINASAIAGDVDISHDGSHVRLQSLVDAENVFTVETRGDQKRVLVTMFDGPAVLGWASAASLQPRVDLYRTTTPVARNTNDRTRDRYARRISRRQSPWQCVSSERVDVNVRVDNGYETVGWIDAGTSFQRSGVGNDGMFTLALETPTLQVQTPIFAQDHASIYCRAPQ